MQKLIRFRKPRLEKQSTGDLYIVLTEEGTWESFPLFAAKLASQIGAKVIEQTESPDAHLWKINYSGKDLRLVYDDFPNGITIEPTTRGQDDVIEALFQIFLAEASADGI